MLSGNRIDKERLANPLARALVAGFDRALLALADTLPAPPATIHEVGCGEGRLSRLLHARAAGGGRPVRATDFAPALIAANTARGDAPGIRYAVRSLYALDPAEDAADLVVCCEVLEHLHQPAAALAALRGLRARDYLLSVPREPLWRVLNVLRGQYLGAGGNTPGHLQHWSAAGFVRWLERGGFRVVRRRLPLPWTMVHARRR